MSILSLLGSITTPTLVVLFKDWNHDTANNLPSLQTWNKSLYLLLAALSSEHIFLLFRAMLGGGAGFTHSEDSAFDPSHVSPFTSFLKALVSGPNSVPSQFGGIYSVVAPNAIGSDHHAFDDDDDKLPFITRAVSALLRLLLTPFDIAISFFVPTAAANLSATSPATAKDMKLPAVKKSQSVLSVISQTLFGAPGTARSVDSGSGGVGLALTGSMRRSLKARRLKFEAKRRRMEMVGVNVTAGIFGGQVRWRSEIDGENLSSKSKASVSFKESMERVDSPTNEGLHQRNTSSSFDVNGVSTKDKKEKSVRRVVSFMEDVHPAKAVMYGLALSAIHELFKED
jgi:hypothetical protein